MIKLDLLPHHLKECEHNPKKKVSCEQGCGLTVPKDEMKVTIDLFGEFFETLLYYTGKTSIFDVDHNFSIYLRIIIVSGS